MRQMTVLLMMLGCAVEDEAVEPRWRQATIPCVAGMAEWEPGPNVLAMSIRSEEGTNTVYYGGGVVTEDGVLEMWCDGDLLVLYATIEE